MRDEDKPFVLTRYNRFLFNIAPRNLWGWLQMGVWMALLAPVVYVFHRYTDGLTDASRLRLASAAFFAASTAWLIAGVWWMKARAEVVDVARVRREQRMTERKRRR